MPPHLAPAFGRASRRLPLWAVREVAAWRLSRRPLTRRNWYRLPSPAHALASTRALIGDAGKENELAPEMAQFADVRLPFLDAGDSWGECGPREGRAGTMQGMATREQLHREVDALPGAKVARARIIVAPSPEEGDDVTGV